MRSLYVLTLSSIIALTLNLGSGPVARAQEELSINCARQASGVIGEESDCVDATITYGTTKITAGRFKMRNLDATQGEWNLSDGVSVETDNAGLEADGAVVRLENGEIVSFALSGSPSRISHVAEDDAFRISAEAVSIFYDVPTESLELKGDASGGVRFIYGESVFETCEMAYNLGTRSYSTGNCGFRSTVPQSEGEAERATGQQNGP